MRANRALVISRWDKKFNFMPYVQKFQIGNSQDVYVFCDVVKIEVNLGLFDFLIGEPACDNRFCYLLKDIGYELSNCCFDVVTIHYHKGAIINYKNKDCLPPPYEYVKANYNDIISFQGKIRYFYLRMVLFLFRWAI